MAKSSKVNLSLTIKSADIVPTGLNRSISMTATASDDTSEFGKMVTSASVDTRERITKSATADRLMLYVKNISSTSTTKVFLSMDVLSNASTNSHANYTHNGPVFCERAVGEFICIPFKDYHGTDSTSKGVFVSGDAAGEIEYMYFELD